jgi:hypothetical protein
MPNISGIITDGKTLEKPDEILSQYRNVHSLEGVGFTHREFKTQTCVICNILTGILKTTLNQPVHDRAENTFLFLEGEIYNTDELLAYLNEPKDLSQCSILLELFLTRGDEFVSLLNGEFNIVIYRKAENKITILNDHLASKPMYYMEEDSSLLFGSEKKSILAVTENSSTVDPLGLLQVFAFYQNIGDRTFIKGIKRLPPASNLTYSNGRTNLKRNYSLKFRVPDSVPKIDSLLDEWCDHLKQATIRRIKNKNRILINLSGGLDSRALALAIPKSFRPIFARTKGRQKANEVLYASEIARRLGFSHYIEEPEKLLFSKIISKVVWRTECAINFLGCLSIANHTQMKEHADCLVGGVYGNVLSGGQISPYMFLPCNRDAFIAKIYDTFLNRSAVYLNFLFNEEFLRKLLPALRESFFDSFEHIAAESNIMLYETWCILESNRQLTLSSSPADSHLFEHIRPLLDKNHINFVMTLPTSLRFGAILYHTMIHHFGPEITDIPYANTNLNLRKTVFGNAINKSIALGLRGYAKTFRNSWFPARYKYVPADHEGFANYIRKDQEFRRIIKSFIGSPSFDPSIFNRQGIMTILNKHYQNNSNYTFPLCLLATFAVGIPYFITNRPNFCPPDAEPLVQNSW